MRWRPCACRMSCASNRSSRIGERRNPRGGFGTRCGWTADCDAAHRLRNRLAQWAPVLSAQVVLESSGGWTDLDSSTGFLLPDGSVFNPDASLIRLERWQALSPSERRPPWNSAVQWGQEKPQVLIHAVGSGFNLIEAIDTRLPHQLARIPLDPAHSAARIAGQFERALSTLLTLSHQPRRDQVNHQGGPFKRISAASALGHWLPPLQRTI